MSEVDDDYHVRLAETVKKSNMMFIISGYESSLYKELYKDWRAVFIETVANKGRRVKEWLWLSPNINTNKDRLF
jgi:site-specific DNA-adenine methylase